MTNLNKALSFFYKSDGVETLTISRSFFVIHFFHTQVLFVMPRNRIFLHTPVAATPKCRDHPFPHHPTQFTLNQIMADDAKNARATTMKRKSFQTDYASQARAADLANPPKRPRRRQEPVVEVQGSLLGAGSKHMSRRMRRWLYHGCKR